LACPISAASGGIEEDISNEETSDFGQAWARPTNGSDRGFARSNLNRSRNWGINFPYEKSKRY